MSETNNFDQAFERLMGFEGGLSDNKNDKGGLTRYGISQNAYPDINILDLTRDKARFLYKNDYWNRNRLNDIKYPLNFLIFDFIVN